MLYGFGDLLCNGVDVNITQLYQVKKNKI